VHDVEYWLESFGRGDLKDKAGQHAYSEATQQIGEVARQHLEHSMEVAAARGFARFLCLRYPVVKERRAPELRALAPDPTMIHVTAPATVHPPRSHWRWIDAAILAALLLLCATKAHCQFFGPLTVQSNGTKIATIAAVGTFNFTGGGTPCTASGTTITCSFASGSSGVSSVGLTMPAQFTVTGSPVTSSGTLAASWATEAANLVFAGPSSGVAATPTFRALLAADIPTGIPIANVGSAGLSGTSPITIASTGAIGCSSCLTSAPVTSVFTRTGAVTAQAGDYTFDLIGAGTNTHALLIGTGGSLGVSGTGTIVATSATGNAGTATACATTDGCWPKGGAMGTPSSLTLTNATGLPVGGISATGTPGSTTFLEGDGKWATPSGSGATFQTNGTNNSSQTTLNLVAGTNVTLTNTSGGNVTVAATGGSSGPLYVQTSVLSGDTVTTNDTAFASGTYTFGGSNPLMCTSVGQTYHLHGQGVFSTTNAGNIGPIIKLAGNYLNDFGIFTATGITYGPWRFELDLTCDGTGASASVEVGMVAFVQGGVGANSGALVQSVVSGSAGSVAPVTFDASGTVVLTIHSGIDGGAVGSMTLRQTILQ